ncbi:MAG: Flp pilus assembly complex ATPase component TadA [Marinospirillum sp.]|uniref:GspE/PulE family protein n=1 Tax=Marinospirillum sp. TaxID=2183934 RepID=UPI0019E31DCD|nr:ATPase, T2SS/T4P/T4SS family [Marinospirillum sp.]MBE0506259.1 Flp pilus assembly complex ATPase component TadA [Marinospirillum sp.]
MAFEMGGKPQETDPADHADIQESKLEPKSFDDAFFGYSRDDIQSILEEWGWPNGVGHPDIETEAALHLALKNKKYRIGEIAIRLGVMSEEEVAEVLAEQAKLKADIESGRIKGVSSKRKFVGLASDMFASVASAGNRLNAVFHGIPYYRNLDGVFELHPFAGGEQDDDQILSATDRNAIANHLTDIQAALLKHNESPLLVFQSYAALTQWQTGGREVLSKDPILKAFGLDRPYQIPVALSEIDEVAKLSGGGHSEGSGSGDRSAATISMSALEAKAEHESERAYKKLAQVLEYAISRKDSDIAIIPTEEGTGMIQSRTARELRTIRAVPLLNAKEMEVVCRYLRKVTHASMDNTIPREPEDGEMRFSCRYGTAFIRASFIPVKKRGISPYVVSISLRLQREGGLGNDTRLRLEQLGLAEITQTLIKDALRLNEGLIVLAGPTNSGKSTTIAAMLDKHRELKGDTVKRLSLEQPVERAIPGVIQFDVPKHMKFSRVLEGFMRHDPDLIFMGEIRDEGSAIAGVQASTTGHLVLTTTHAKTAVGAFTRMLNLMGSDAGGYRQDLAEAIELIVAQRLVPFLCPQCRIKREVTEDEKAHYIREMRRAGLLSMISDDTEHLLSSIPMAYQLPSHVHDRDRDGCNHCRSAAGEGVIRDMPINEVLVMSRKLRSKLIAGTVTESDLAEARETTLLEQACIKLNAGEIEFGVFIGFANQA